LISIRFNLIQDSPSSHRFAEKRPTNRHKTRNFACRFIVVV